MAVEYRGCRGLVYAEVTKDDNEVDGGYTAGTVKLLAPVAEISKTTSSDSATSFYDNVAANVRNGEGADEVTFTIAIPDDVTLAEITGRVYDTTKKMYIEAPRKNKYFAVGYILGETGNEDGNDERYVWRLKGSFNIPDETSATEDDGTDANNMSLVFTGIYTTHVFTNGGGTGVKSRAKAVSQRKSDGISETTFFAKVTTPDTTGS